MKIGAFPISSFDGDTPEQIISDHLYYVVKHQLLSEYNWSFSTIQRELNMINAKPLFNFKYVFALPEDVISVITAYNLCGGKIDYKIVKDELHTNDFCNCIICSGFSEVSFVDCVADTEEHDKTSKVANVTKENISFVFLIIHSFLPSLPCQSKIMIDIQSIDYHNNDTDDKD